MIRFPSPVPFLLLALPIAAPGCGGEGGPGEGPQGPWPEGTVLLVAGRPVDRSGIDPLAEAMAELEPAASLDHRRRLALLHLTVPLELARAEADEVERRRARAAAEAFRDRARGAEDRTLGPHPDPGLERLEGDFLALGIPRWFAARGLEPGAWSEVLELPGAFVVLQVVSRSEARRGAERRFTVLEARFPYHGDPERLALETVRTRVVPIDPDWEAAVPGLLRHR